MFIVLWRQNRYWRSISFSIKAGSKTAIIGPTAAGKSQLLYLLTNLIFSKFGYNRIRWHTLRPITRKNISQPIGFVFQDSVIFNMSLSRKHAFNDEVTKESLEKAICNSRIKWFYWITCLRNSTRLFLKGNKSFQADKTANNAGEGFGNKSPRVSSLTISTSTGLTRRLKTRSFAILKTTIRVWPWFRSLKK